jgi:hypothetical protein
MGQRVSPLHAAVTVELPPGHQAMATAVRVEKTAIHGSQGACFVLQGNPSSLHLDNNGASRGGVWSGGDRCWEAFCATGGGLPVAGSERLLSFLIDNFFSAQSRIYCRPKQLYCRPRPAGSTTACRLRCSRRWRFAHLTVANARGCGQCATGRLTRASASSARRQPSRKRDS